MTTDIAAEVTNQPREKATGGPVLMANPLLRGGQMLGAKTRNGCGDDRVTRAVIQSMYHTATVAGVS